MTVGHSNTNNLSSPSNMGQAEILLVSGGVSSISSVVGAATIVA